MARQPLRKTDQAMPQACEWRCQEFGQLLVNPIKAAIHLGIKVIVWRCDNKKLARQAECPKCYPCTPGVVVAGHTKNFLTWRRLSSCSLAA
jgi:ribosomal protein S27AE